MKREEFEIGKEFHCGEGIWQTTDIGARVIVAIRVDQVEVVELGQEAKPRLFDRATATKEGWFNGPPYAVAERVFDENDMKNCFTNPEAGTAA